MAKHLTQAIVAFDLARDVALDPTKEGSEPAQRLVGALELFCVLVALMRDERMFADPLIGLAQRSVTPCFLASSTRRSRARCISLASVGKATAFSCTVVSTITLEKSDGFAAPARVATARLS